LLNYANILLTSKTDVIVGIKKPIKSSKEKFKGKDEKY